MTTQLTAAQIAAHYDAMYALAGMVLQCAYQTTYRNQRAFYTGGMSSLENAFDAIKKCGCDAYKNGWISAESLYEFQAKVWQEREKLCREMEEE